MKKHIFIDKMETLPNGLTRFHFTEKGRKFHIDGGVCCNAFIHIFDDVSFVETQFETVYGIQEKEIEDGK